MHQQTRKKKLKTPFLFKTKQPILIKLKVFFTADFPLFSCQEMAILQQITEIALTSTYLFQERKLKHALTNRIQSAKTTLEQPFDSAEIHQSGAMLKSVREGRRTGKMSLIIGTETLGTGCLFPCHHDHANWEKAPHAGAHSHTCHVIQKLYSVMLLKPSTSPARI